MKRIGGVALALAALCGVAGAATAQVPAPDESGFQAYLGTLRAQAQAAGVSRATIEAVFPTLTLNMRVVQLDRAQPESDPNAPVPNFAPYRAAHIDAARISRGRQAYQAQRYRLQRIEQQTGVPESIMVAIWGNETNYGSIMGNFDIPRALASLAYDGRRRELFSGEFVDALKMIDRGVPMERLKGSWAGAMGGPQFLPSVYLRLARDGDGDGRADIWTSDADTLA